MMKMTGKNYVNMISNHSSYHIVNKKHLTESNITHSTTYWINVSWL